MRSTSKSHQPRMTPKDLRQRNIADKAAGQCCGDIGLCVDGLTTIVDVAVRDATAPSYRQPPPAPPPPPDPSVTLEATAASEDVVQQIVPAPCRGRKKKK